MGNIALEKSMNFSVRIVRLYQYLCKEKKEFILSKQLLRSGTSIGANLREAKYAQSTNDFISKNSIALKEAAETEYWLELLFHTEFLTEKEYNAIKSDCSQLIKILTSIIKTTKTHNN